MTRTELTKKIVDLYYAVVSEIRGPVLSFCFESP